MLWKVEKSNKTGHWSGRQWWVEADSEAAAIAQGRKNWPSKNDVDQYHATPLTQEEIDAYYREQAEHDMRRVSQGIRTNRNAERIAAYHEKLAANKNNPLDANVARVGLTPAIVKCAERIDQEKQRAIDAAYRGSTP